MNKDPKYEKNPKDNFEELVKKMQSEESKNGVKKTFNASAEDLASSFESGKPEQDNKPS